MTCLRSHPDNPVLTAPMIILKITTVNRGGKYVDADVGEVKIESVYAGADVK